MSKVTHWLTLIWPYLCIVIVSCFYLSPFLSQPSFNLIDDGLNVQAGQRVINDFSVKTIQDVLVNDELKLGRMRPLYFLFSVLLFAVVGPSATGFWVTQCILLALTLSLVYTIIVSQTKTKSVSLIASLLLLLAPSFAENYFRLGTAETKQVIFMLVLILWFKKIELKHQFSIWASTVALALLIIPLFIKETAITMFGWVSVLFASHWAKKEWLTPGALSLWLVMLLSVIGFVLILPSGSGYSSNYIISFAVMKESALVLRIIKAETIWLLFAGIWVFGTRFLHQLRHKKLTVPQLVNTIFQERWQLTSIGVALGSILILLPWKYKLERYFYFTEIMTIVILSVEAVASYKYWKDQLLTLYQQKKQLELHPKLSWIFGSLFFLMIATKIFFPVSPLHFEKLPHSTWKNLTTWYTQYQYSGAITSYLQTEIEPNTTLLIDYSDYEVVYELGIFASRFSSQPVRVLSPNEQVELDFGGIYETNTNFASELATPSGKVLVVRGSTDLDTYHLTETQLWPREACVIKDDTMVWKIYGAK